MSGLRDDFLSLGMAHNLVALLDLDILTESDALDGVDALLRLGAEPPEPSEVRLAASFGLK